ncbi:hypothetical protein [Synechococcus sp. GEYO]|uniref:beta strand repeat-containing protein n=1 Tax=Synechococcus sp. GEYO TaxID=2575511 RepID=UPI000E0F3435|nr:hypothetical protein [Synechococcus sp. GEYO]
MANIFVPSPNTTTLGTDSNDTIVLNTGLQVTVQGLAGNDVITASAGGVSNFTLVRLNGGEGNDTIAFSASEAGDNANASFLGGAGNDVVSADNGTFTASLIQGGGGNDTIVLSAGNWVAGSTIGSNAGDDLITASAYRVTTSLIGAGAGNDTIILSAGATFQNATIAGGGGNDTISAGGAFTGSVQIKGDEIGTIGNDTIVLSAVGNAASAALVQGAGGADRFTIGSFVGTGATINGNYGKDSIVVSANGIESAGMLIGGGAGADTITLSAVINTGDFDTYATVQGGGGTDLITIDAAARSHSFTGGANNTAVMVFGGAGADTILLDAAGASDSGTYTANGYLRYDAFSESNITTTDVVSAFSGAAGNALDETNSGNAIVVTQDVADMTLLTQSVSGTYTVANGKITEANWFGNQTDISARITFLDSIVEQGKTVVLEGIGGTDYLFVQGGAAGSGIEGDLLVQLGNQVASASIASVSAVTLTI